MQAVARARNGREELRRFGVQRFCSSQAWFAPPFLHRYGETDPNAPGGVASPRVNSYPPSNVAGMNRPTYATQHIPPPPSLAYAQHIPPQPSPAYAAQHIPPPPLLPAFGASRPGTQQPTPTLRAPEANSSSEAASEVFTSLIELFQRKGMLQELDSLLRGIKESRLVLSLPAYRTLMDFFAQQGDLERMDMVYVEMRKATMQSSGYPQPELTEQKKLDISEFLANMADSCYKKGLLEEVQLIHRAMKAAHLSISLRMYNVLINTYSQLRDCRSMDAVYVEMREALAQSRGGAVPRGFPGAAPPPPGFAAPPPAASPPPGFAAAPGVAFPPPPFAAKEFNPVPGHYGENVPRPPGGEGWSGDNFQLPSTLPPGSRFPSNYPVSPPGSQYQPPGNAQFPPRYPPPPPYAGQPFRPPTPGQHVPHPGPGHQPVPGASYQYPGHPPAQVPGYPPHPGSQFHFQPGQVAVPLVTQPLQPPPSTPQQVQASDTSEEPSAVVEEAEEEVEEDVEEEVEEEGEEEAEEAEEAESETAEGEVQQDTVSAEGAEEESSEEHQDSVGDTENVGAEALESVVRREEQAQQPHLMESTG